MLRILAVLAVVAAAVVTFFVWHHPPMRLMPPPLLFHDDGTGLTRVADALATDSRIEVFYATNRLPVGFRDDRIYTVAPDRRMHVGTATLRIGGEESTLDQLREWSTQATGDRPFIHLERMREAATVGDGEETGWLAEIDVALAVSRTKDVLVYVHGANTTVERAAGQAAQIRHFAGREAVVVLFPGRPRRTSSAIRATSTPRSARRRTSPTSSRCWRSGHPPRRSTYSPTAPVVRSAAMASRG